MSFLKTLTVVVLLTTRLAAAEELDAGLTKLADELSGKISKAGIKKVSVLDFTDLQGNTNELGRYMAEQLSVSLANAARDFSVMNRGNLASILVEHKLTSTGLVNPENARKLGQFAGVDALIMGTIATLGDTLSVTAQVITTETAQLVGGSPIKIARSKDVDALMDVATTAKTIAEGGGDAFRGGKDFVAVNGTTAFDDLTIELQSFRFIDNGILLTLKFTNRNKGEAIRYGINSDDSRAVATLIDEHGASFQMEKATGINRGGTGYASNFYQQYFSELQSEYFRERAINKISELYQLDAGHSTVVTLNFPTKKRNVGEVFRLHAEIVVAVLRKNSLPVLRLNNVMMDGLRVKR